MNQQYTLQRTGGAPVAFIGEQIAFAATPIETGPKQHQRYHSCHVYRTRTGKSWVVHIQTFTSWDHERTTSTVTVVRGLGDSAGAERIASAIYEYDPLAPIVGYPTGPQFAEKQARLRDWHRRAWLALVSEVLGQIPAATEVLP